MLSACNPQSPLKNNDVKSIGSKRKSFVNATRPMVLRLSERKSSVANVNTSSPSLTSPDVSVRLTGTHQRAALVRTKKQNNGESCIQTKCESTVGNNPSEQQLQEPILNTVENITQTTSRNVTTAKGNGRPQTARPIGKFRELSTEREWPLTRRISFRSASVQRFASSCAAFANRLQPKSCSGARFPNSGSGLSFSGNPACLGRITACAAGTSTTSVRCIPLTSPSRKTNAHVSTTQTCNHFGQRTTFANQTN